MYIDGEVGEDMYTGGEKVVCTSDMEGVIYSDSEVTLSVDETTVTFAGRVSSNPLSTSDWNKQHNATTDGSKKLVRPDRVEFEIVKTDDAFVLLREGNVDVYVPR